MGRLSLSRLGSAGYAWGVTAATWMDEVLHHCAKGGVDLGRPFPLRAFHAEAPRSEWLDTFGEDDPLALVLGNTRALWAAFLAALRDDPGLCERPHPLDDYVERVVGEALARVPVAHVVYWGHHRAERVVPLQRLARAAGLAELGPAHLSVHPEHGPWIGLRAVVVFAAPASELSPQPTSPSHCAGCAAPCVPALARALAVSQSGEPQASIPFGWTQSQKAWLAVRDACPVGTAARYGAPQLHYHYTKDRGTLLRAVAAESAAPPAVASEPLNRPRP